MVCTGERGVRSDHIRVHGAGWVRGYNHPAPTYRSRAVGELCLPGVVFGGRLEAGEDLVEFAEDFSVEFDL